ncbi:MAG: hypothetical protein JSU72_13045 [Deltaproteobacteria bacterium]|nr:MAG: hypothetical protein JSU72_13045 [Deltaproteobacteria bacterium]
MKKSVFIALVVSALFSGLVSCQAYRADSDQKKGEAPVIVDSFAVDAIRPGAVWRVYLHATDDDGDMNDITALVTQPGIGRYPTSITRLQDGDGREVTGYIFLRTPPDNGLLSDTLNLQVMVGDGQGNRSSPVEFRLSFRLESLHPTPERWAKSADRALGAINVDIRSTREPPRRRRR